MAPSLLSKSHALLHCVRAGSVPAHILQLSKLRNVPAHTSRFLFPAARLHGSRSSWSSLENATEKSPEQQPEGLGIVKTERDLQREKIELLVEKGNVKNIVKAIKKFKMFEEYSLEAVFEKRNVADAEVLSLIANNELQAQVNPLPYFQHLVKKHPERAIKYFSALEIDKHCPGAVDIKTLMARLVEGGHAGAVIQHLGKDPQCEKPLLEMLTEHNLPLARLYASSQSDLDINQAPLFNGYLTLPPIKTLFVSTKVGLAKARIMLADPKIKRVGVDTESRPNFGGGKNNPTALMQVATEDFVVVFDMQTLMGPDMAQVIRDLLANDDITKLGVGLQYDVKMLRDSYPKYDFVLHNHVDLSEMFCKRYPGLMSPSLAKMCAYTYGKILSKTQRMSNWGRRPLTEAQLQYAMLDAWCLLGVHDTLSGGKLANDKNSNNTQSNDKLSNNAHSSDTHSNDTLANDKPSTARLSNNTPINDTPSNEPLSNDMPSYEKRLDNIPLNDKPSNDTLSKDTISNDTPSKPRTKKPWTPMTPAERKRKPQKPPGATIKKPTNSEEVSRLFF